MFAPEFGQYLNCDREKLLKRVVLSCRWRRCNAFAGIRFWKFHYPFQPFLFVVIHTLKQSVSTRSQSALILSADFIEGCFRRNAKKKTFSTLEKNCRVFTPLTES